VKTDNTPHRSGIGWRSLGELELPAGANMEETLYAWLTEILHPLELPVELFNKIVASAQDAVARAQRFDTWTIIGHIHLAVFAPKNIIAHGKVWGFFRIDKIDDVASSMNHPNHIVEFYLYQERQ
jgi:hypothetical protein